jgi:hypothetical protein
MRNERAEKSRGVEPILFPVLRGAVREPPLESSQALCLPALLPGTPCPFRRFAKLWIETARHAADLGRNITKKPGTFIPALSRRGVFRRDACPTARGAKEGS